jgi:hypothetical protein
MRVRPDIVDGAWNRNLMERDQAPSEAVYLMSFHYDSSWRGGARVRRR